jgi:hypothetical protein
MSNPDGPNILAAIRQTRKLMVEISKLLLEADAILGAAGWEPRAGTTALSGGAVSINTPTNWIPYRAFRFYQHAEYSIVVPCVSVILEGYAPNEKVTEPLVSGLVMEYDTVEELPQGNMLYRIATWHLHVHDRRDDGTVFEIVPRDLWNNESTAKSMRSFAIPLVSVESREHLERTVVAPLLKMTGERVADGSRLTT